MPPMRGRYFIGKISLTEKIVYKRAALKRNIPGNIPIFNNIYVRLGIGYIWYIDRTGIN